MSDRARLTLLRSGLILLSIVGAVFVFSVLMSIREGTATAPQVVLGVIIAGLLIWMNRWWVKHSGERL